MKSLIAIATVVTCFSFSANASHPEPTQLKGKSAAQLTSLLKSGGIGAIETSVNNKSALPSEITYSLGEFSCSSHRLGNQSDFVTGPSCTGTVNAQALAMILLLDQAEVSDTTGAMKSPEDRWRYDIEIKSIVCKIKTDDLSATCEIQPAEALN